MKRIIILTLFLSSHIALGKTVIGLLQGEEEILVKSKSQGEVIEVIKSLGDKVEEGDALAIIEHKKEMIQMELSKTEFETAKADFEKSQKLKKYISADELMKKKNDFLRKKSSYELAVYNLESKTIKAPISGIITKAMVKRGQNITSGFESYEVINMDSLVIELDVNAKDTMGLKKGNKLAFTSELHPKEKFHANVSLIGPVLDKASGTVHIKLNLENKSNSMGNYILRPGTMVQVSLPRP